MKDCPHFLLVGNSPYSNRGCEAIVRGTMAILRHEFGEDVRATVASFGLPEEVAKQAATETDAHIRHVWLPKLRRPPAPPCSTTWWRRQFWRVYARLLRRCNRPSPLQNEIDCVMDLANLNGSISEADCAMQIGGDNYSLDNGLPIRHMRIDRHLWKASVPLVLWGASVGPFDVHPAFATEMFVHLRSMNGIFVRESKSFDYLRRHEANQNLRSMSDPAFAMDAIEPQETKVGFMVPQGAIGLNFSPLLARYVAGGDSAVWTRACIEIVKRVSSQTGCPIVLVPHDTTYRGGDHALLSAVASEVPGAACVSDRLSAAETKWVISRCSVFAGARTHATIAAISSCVPTLSLAYSTKAIGLNQDIFGSQDYCVHPGEFAPAAVSERIVSLHRKADRVREHLARVLPDVRAAVERGPTFLREVLAQTRSPRMCRCRICRSP